MKILGQIRQAAKAGTAGERAKRKSFLLLIVNKIDVSRIS